MEELEREKLELERKKIEGELKLRRDEIDLKKDEMSRNLWRSPLLIGIILAFVGLIANLVVIYVQNENAKIEAKEKLESSLIIESIKTGDPKKAQKNLEFLIKVGFIEDPDDKIIFN